MSIDILSVPEEPLASVGILATNELELQKCLSGLQASGFDSTNIKIMVVRNFGVNLEDGYSGIAKFIDQAEGRFLMVLHQDVTPIDSLSDLIRCLDELDRMEPDWAVAGNAGYVSLGTPARRLSDPYLRDQRIGPFPAQVWGLDENLLIFNMRNPVRPSKELHGFHFYGTDLVLKARLAGSGSYVIDWHVLHESSGNLDTSWKQGLARLEAAYDERMGTAMIQTPTTILLFGLFKPLRIARKSVLSVVRQGSRALRNMGLKR